MRIMNSTRKDTAGENNVNAKLTEAQAAEIRALNKERLALVAELEAIPLPRTTSEALALKARLRDYTQVAVGERYGVSAWSVARIWNKGAWTGAKRLPTKPTTDHYHRPRGLLLDREDLIFSVEPWSSEYNGRI